MQHVLTILAEGFEEIEAVTVIDLLRRAEIEVTVAGQTTKEITGSHGITLMGDTTLEAVQQEKYDALFLPGGQPGTTHLKEDPRVVALVKDFYQRSCFVTAICAAPTVLHKAGITSGIAITSYPSEASVFKEARYLEKPVVRSGRIITGRGVGTAIPFALTLVRAWKGEAAARKLAGAILFDQPF